MTQHCGPTHEVKSVDGSVVSPPTPHQAGYMVRPHGAVCEGPGQVSSRGFSGPREMIRLRKQATHGTSAHTCAPPNTRYLTKQNVNTE